MHSIHQFKVTDIDGGEIDFKSFEGKKIIVVNVASQCGFTPQYQQLEELYQEFSEKLIIVGVPTNNFGGQEPGTNDEIRTFCQMKYGVSFPLSAKIDVRESPVYQWLTSASKNGVLDSEVSWNFQKYLLDESGALVKMLPSSVSPMDESVLDWLGA
ncbi:MAG: glutathione peroxidase [Saprospiraceae bacterium]|nr:glutathione peroxidase [Saprospiraceae bacterium]